MASQRDGGLIGHRSSFLLVRLRQESDGIAAVQDALLEIGRSGEVIAVNDRPNITAIRIDSSDLAEVYYAAARIKDEAAPFVDSAILVCPGQGRGSQDALLADALRQFASYESARGVIVLLIDGVVQKLLVVDPDKEQCDYLETRLQAKGFTVVCAQTGEQGLAIARAFSPDLIVSEFGLPDIDGDMWLGRLRAELPQVPVVILSNRKLEEDIVRSLELGAADYIAKPYSSLELIARIRRIMRVSDVPRGTNSGPVTGFGGDARWQSGDAEERATVRRRWLIAPNRWAALAIIPALVLASVPLFGSLAAGSWASQVIGETAPTDPLPLQAEPPRVLLPRTPVAASVAPAPSIPGWRLVFNSDFRSAGALRQWNLVRWSYPYSRELQFYLPQNVSVADGMLRLTARREPYYGSPFTSGMVTTQGKMSFRYGMLLVRAKLVDAQGVWPAVWMLPEQGGSPLPELDIVEAKGEYPNTVWMSQHWRITATLASDVHHLYSGPDFSKGFHTFGIIWLPGEVMWTVDGTVEYARQDHVPDVPMYLVVNLAVGGIFPGNPAPSTPFPQTMEVKWVRVYQLSDARGAHTAPTLPGRTVNSPEGVGML